jgi:hypothetical protein
MRFSPWSWIYEVHLRKGRIALTFLGLEVVKVPLNEIKSIRRMRFFDFFLSIFALRWHNRWPWNGVVIESRRGRYLVTPAEPNEFIRQVESAKSDLD